MEDVNNKKQDFVLNDIVKRKIFEMYNISTSKSSQDSEKSEKSELLNNNSESN